MIGQLQWCSWGHINYNVVGTTPTWQYQIVLQISHRWNSVLEKRMLDSLLLKISTLREYMVIVCILFLNGRNIHYQCYQHMVTHSFTDRHTQQFSSWTSSEQSWSHLNFSRRLYRVWLCFQWRLINHLRNCSLTCVQFSMQDWFNKQRDREQPWVFRSQLTQSVNCTYTLLLWENAQWTLILCTVIAAVMPVS